MVRSRTVLTVAIPTLGRPSLARTVFSFIDQLEDGDEVLLVADPKGDRRYAEFMREVGSNRLGVNWRVLGQAGDGWGHPQRNRAYDAATPGSFVWCIADDDVATPGALDAIRVAVKSGPPWFLCRTGRGTADPWMWADMGRGLVPGNLDADCIVAPAGVTARWGVGYTGDLDFAVALRAELGEPAWHSSVIAVTKPSGEYLVGTHYPALARV